MVHTYFTREEYVPRRDVRDCFPFFGKNTFQEVCLSLVAEVHLQSSRRLQKDIPKLAEEEYAYAEK